MKLSLVCLPKVNVVFKYIYAYLEGNLRFCEIELKVSDREWKMVLTL